MDKKLRQRTEHDHHREMVMSRHRDPGPFAFVLVLDTLKAGFNVAKIFRSANALGCRELHLVNIPVFDPAPARGTIKQTRSQNFNTVGDSFLQLKSLGYRIFALDPSGGETLGVLKLPEKSAFVVGHEEYGFSFSFSEFPFVERVRIAQFGQVQSLNASVAASLAAYEWVRQFKMAGATSVS